MKELAPQELGEVIGSHELVLVDFWAAWCGPCRTLRPRLEELEREFHGILFVAYDVDQDLALSSRYGVQSLPTITLFRAGQLQQSWLNPHPRQLAGLLRAI